jgi:hypothetical protein
LAVGLNRLDLLHPLAGARNRGSRRSDDAPAVRLNILIAWVVAHGQIGERGAEVGD